MESAYWSSFCGKHCCIADISPSGRVWSPHLREEGIGRGEEQHTRGVGGAQDGKPENSDGVVPIGALMVLEIPTTTSVVCGEKE